MLTLKDAAAQTGKTKQAVQQAIKNGRLSAQKNDSGAWMIDPAELFRVYPPVKLSSKQEQAFDDACPKTLQLDIKILQHEIETKDDKITLLQKMIEDIRQERNDWKEQAQSLQSQNRTLLIAHAERPKERTQGLLGRLFG